MTIAAGQKLPDATLTQMTDKGPQPVKVSQFFTGKKVVLFALPGAFTPTCSNQHLPGFINHADKILQKGVDAIICLSVNDAFVMGAWGKEKGAGGKVLMFADGNGDFTKALGMDFDGSAFGMGTRSLRYAMIVEDGVVKEFHKEENPSKATVSGAEHILSLL